MKGVKPGSFNTMHDIHQSTIDALPTKTSLTTQMQGYTFVTVDELLDYQLRGIIIYYNGN